MSDAGREDVGSVGEEAAKLFGVLSDWARTQDAGHVADDLGERLTAAARSVNDHVATGGEDCRYCPVCQAIGVVRSTSPEVRAHLTSAAGSLVQAVAGLLATHVPTDAQTGQSRQAGQSSQPDRDRGPVEHIDLDGDDA